MVRPTVILTQSEIEQLVDLGELIPAVEQCYAEFEKGHDLLPDKLLVRIGGGQAACMTGYTRATHTLTMKLGQERLSNAERGLPTSCGVLNMFDPDTGELLLICESMLPTQFRTAAAAAVGADRLARHDARTLAVIGAGRLGRQCARAVFRVRPFERLLINDHVPAAAESLAADLRRELPVPVITASAEEACREADVICTATNSLEPIVRNEWIRPGVHLSCMGSDLPEKIEVDPELTARCRLFADNVEHCIRRGEASQAIEQGLLPPDPYAGSLGQVINGSVPGRLSGDEITMFDSIGIGILDTIIARQLFDQAVEKNRGSRIRFV